MSVTRQHFTVAAESGSLKKIRDFCTDALSGSGVSQPVSRQLILAVDEAASNVVDHAYTGPNAPRLGGEVDIDIELRDGQLVVEIRDRGVPFNPLEMLPADSEAPVSMRRKRGYGLSIIRRVVEDLRYERSAAGENILTLVKLLDSRTQLSGVRSK